MIKYTLQCDNNHHFESYFANIKTCDDLINAKELVCPHCGSHEIDRALMSPAIKNTTSSPATLDDLTQQLIHIHRDIKQNGHNVGHNFAREARAKHLKTISHTSTAQQKSDLTNEKPLYGTSTPEELNALLEDGIPVIPLPPLPEDHN